MEGLVINSGRRDNKKFKVLDLNSNQELLIPDIESININPWLLAIYYRAEIIRERIQRRHNSEEEKDLFKKLFKVIKNNNRSEISLGDIKVGLDSESYYAENIVKNLKDGEHICMSYNLDAESQIDFIKVKLSEDRKGFEEVTFVQIKSSDNKSKFQVKDTHEKQLRDSYQDQIKNIEKYIPRILKYTEGLHEEDLSEILRENKKAYRDKGVTSADIFLKIRGKFEINNIINARHFYSETVRVYRDEKDQVNSMRSQKE